VSVLHEREIYQLRWKKASFIRNRHTERGGKSSSPLTGGWGGGGDGVGKKTQDREPSKR